MSINVETIGKVRQPHLCRMVSNSDSITAAGRTKAQVVWELSVKKIDEHSCEYSNHIHASATAGFRRA
jgi:hypothetical protein